MTGARQFRWRGAVAATIVLVAAGLTAQRGALLIAGTIPLAYLALYAASRAPDPGGLSVTREIDPSPVPPDRPVAVAVTVTNGSDRTVPDVRVVDDVPVALAVVDGTPRGASTLAPGESLELRYLLLSRRGDHAFGDPRVRVRGVVPGAVTTTRLPADGDGALRCRLDADAPPIDPRGDDRVGQLAADEPGRGVSFHSVREYHPEDPVARIDWRHYAKFGDLATVNYERHVATTVLLALDARPRNRVVAGPGHPTAVELEAYAATRVATDLLGRGHEVGVAALGTNGPGPAGLRWLPPGSGAEQRSRALALFETVAEAETRPPAASLGDSPGGGRAPPDQVRKVLELAPAASQVALFTPMLDGRPVRAATTWYAAGHPVVVLSPDVVPANTVSGQYDLVRRRTRLARCQRAGIRTVDWRRGTPLPYVIERAFLADARLPTARSAAVGARGGR